RTVRDKFPNARWHTYEPAGRENARQGARRAFGANVETRYDLDKAAVILALDADFLACGPGHLRYVRDFSAKRRVRKEVNQPSMNRLYVVESTPSVTGAKADHRLPLKSSQVEDFARALAAKIDNRFANLARPRPAGVPEAWLNALAEDLKQHRGTGV